MYITADALMQAEMATFDAHLRISQLYNALRQEREEHCAEKNQFIAQFQAFRRGAEAKIVEMQAYYQECLLKAVSNENPPIERRIPEICPSDLRNRAETAEFEADETKRQIELLRQERDDLSKLCREFAMRAPLDNAQDRQWRSQRQFLRSNLPVETRMVGDELDFRRVRVITSEDFQEYKLTRNPVNKDGFDQFEEEFNCEIEPTGGGFVVEQPAETSALPFLSKSMASQRQYQADNIRLRAKVSELFDGIKDLGARWQRVSAALRQRIPGATPELSLFEAAFREFWSRQEK